MELRAERGNVRVVRRALRDGSFDVLVGDETYEITVAQEFHLYTVPVPFVMLYDFVGLDAMTGRLTERLGVYFWNLGWSADRPMFAKGNSHGVFIGEPEDIPGTRFGPLLPDRRQHARRCYEFAGYILPFDPAAFRDRAGARADLGYGPEPLVVCSAGGTWPTPSPGTWAQPSATRRSRPVAQTGSRTSSSNKPGPQWPARRADPPGPAS